MVFFLENVFPLYFWDFSGENQKKIKVGKVRKYDEETDYFEKKNAFIPQKASLTMLQGAKHPRGSRVFCANSTFSKSTHLNSSIKVWIDSAINLDESQMQHALIFVY